MVDDHDRETSRGDAPLPGDGADDTAGNVDGRPSPGDGHHEVKHTHDHDAGHHVHDVETVRVAIVTVSSTRSLDDDPSGDAIVEAFEADGHHIATRELVTDDRDGLQARVDGLVDRDDVDIVVSTGGTGVSPDDVTVEAVRPLFDKPLPGFGELFRRRSEADVGTRVVATRATAGVIDGVPVFCLPGSEAAARLGTEEIIVPEAGHLAGLASRGRDDG